MPLTQEEILTDALDVTEVDDEVHVQVNGIFYSTSFTFQKDQLTSVTEDVSLSRILYHSSMDNPRLAALYAAPDAESQYVAQVELSEVLDINGDVSSFEYFNIRRVKNGVNWNPEATYCICSATQHSSGK